MKEHCRETLERAYLFLDGEALSDAQRLQIEAHLEECGPCYERYGLQREVMRLVARSRGHEKCPEGLRTRIWAFFESR
jgi:mycothiol system anti-sigma-R factor